MNKAITIEGKGKVSLTDKNYLASGGQASVYVKGGLAIKIYTDETQMIPVEKIKELRVIKDPTVLLPKHIVYDSKAKPIGYAMDYKKNTHPFCKLFTKAFKNRNGISTEMISDMVVKGQSTIQNVHDAQCLVVDLNELNILTSKKFDGLYFIDVDSYQTPSYRATAIMESIKDNQIKGNKWTEESDWFSFAILAFQLWIGIHPYKGKHPDYTGAEFLQRMKDGVSVFDKKTSLPKVCSDFSIIPPSHLRWFQQIFIDNARLAPPEMGDISMTITIPTTFNVMSASGLFDINEDFECVENIRSTFNFMGINYIAGKYALYKEKATLPVSVDSSDKVIFCESSNISPVVGLLRDEMLTIKECNGTEVGVMAANGAMYRNGCIYSFYDGKLTENSFTRMNNKVMHKTRFAAQVGGISTKAYDGVIFQDLLGKQHITLPYEQGKVSTLHIKELDGFRILDARSERNVCAIMAEKKGKYYRIVLTFNSTYTKYTIRSKSDVDYADINMTVLPTGVAILATNDQVEIFKGDQVKVMDNPPFDSTTRIYNVNGVLHYVDGKQIFSAKIKK